MHITRKNVSINSGFATQITTYPILDQESGEKVLDIIPSFGHGFSSITEDPDFFSPS